MAIAMNRLVAKRRKAMERRLQRSTKFANVLGRLSSVPKVNAPAKTPTFVSDLAISIYVCEEVRVY